MTDQRTRFAIFRKEEGIDFNEAGIMSPPERGTFDEAAAGRLVAAGMAEGDENELIFSGGGMSLTRVWFKSGYPLPRHSHDCDCLYYVTGGSLKMGAEVLGPGDGFYVGADVPYTYTAGEQGVELLEFRATETFGIRLMGGTTAWLDKAVASVEANREKWKDQPRPSEREPA